MMESMEQQNHMTGEKKQDKTRQEDRNQSEKKRELRRQMKLARKSMDEQERARRNRQILHNVMSLPEIRGAGMVYGYASYGTEADTISLIGKLLAMGIGVALPRVEGDLLRFYELKSMSQLASGFRGIPEPNSSCLPVRDLQAPVITPGLAFTCQGVRLGYGGGYYDRFFAAEPRHRRIGLAYSCQLCGEIPHQPFDQGVHCIVTEEQVIQI